MTNQNAGWKFTTKDVAYMAMYLAMFFVLDWLANTLPLFKMPNGGTLGLGTLALLLASYQLGWQKGLLTAAMSVVLQFATGQMYILGFVQFLLDYLFAFSVYGIACLFPNISVFYSGVLITNAVRFVCSTLSGMWFYGLPLGPSMVYQAAYMVPTLILDLILVPLLVKSIGSRIFKYA